MIRIAEAAGQIQGQGAKKAVAHGQKGICGQHNTVFVLSTD